ncbi:MAG: YegS/Rv2252/BmrU family lipid kinase [Oscillospiraceae bacterium]|jgi:YegS/Rv2252/BmrU family lipid kinase|nr:YegS/Rv2252/BmrU family lipid kinase [Oscillospiraceae bacterium]
MYIPLMLIINPFSGRGLTKTNLGGVVQALCGGGYAVTTYVAGELRCGELAARYGSQYEVVACIGGDGTLSDVIAGLVMLENPPSVGYIPSGTANDVATSLELPRDPNLAVQRILDGALVPLDVGVFAGEFFTYVAAFGAFTGVSYQTPQSAKRALGHLAYIFGGLADMAAIHPVHTIVEFDDGVIEDDFIFGGVTNSLSVAGLVRLEPRDVELADGLFEVLLVKNPVDLLAMGDILHSLLLRDYDNDNVRLLHTTRAKFTFDEDVAWTRDGENGGTHREVEITVKPGAINIIV